MYAGLRVLLKCNYLELDIENSKKNAFSYKETPHLNKLRELYKKQKLTELFSTKKLVLLDELQEKENIIEFINDLLLDDKSLEKYFIDHKKTLENDIKKINSNIRFMDDILNI